MKKEEESSVECRNQFTTKFELLSSVDMLCIYSRSFFFSILFVCLLIFGDVTILHTINKTNRLRLL